MAELVKETSMASTSVCLSAARILAMSVENCCVSHELFRLNPC